MASACKKKKKNKKIKKQKKKKENSQFKLRFLYFYSRLVLLSHNLLAEILGS